MPRRLTVVLNDGLYSAARDEARRQGRSDGRTDGVASLTRGALRAYLNRAGYKVSDLDATQSDPVPGGRNGRNERGSRI